jgi:translocation and assembly module TamB
MKKLLLLAILIMVAAILVAAGWLLYTPSGARFVIGSLSHADGFTLTVGAATGRLADVVELRDTVIRMRDTPLTISAERTRIAWRPAALLRGVMAVDRVGVSGLRIDDDRPPERPPSLVLPHVSNLAAALTASIRELDVESVVYRDRGKETLSIRRCRAAVVWHHGIVSVNRLVLEGRLFSAQGMVEVGLLTPLVRADVSVALQERPGTIESVKLKSALKQAGAAGELRGAVTATATGEGGTARIEGTAAVRRHEIVLSAFTLAHSALAGSITGDAAMLLTKAAPELRLDAALHDVAPGTEKTAHVRMAGTVHGAGTIAAYRGTFDVAVRPRSGKGRPWETAAMAGAFSGSSRALRLEITGGRWLGGTIRGTGDIAWTGGPAVVASIQARDLQPASLSPDWKGVINIDTSLKASRSASSGFSGSAAVVSPRSVLRGRPFSADVRVDFGRGLLRLTRFALQGNGFDIRAGGVLAEKIDYRVNVTDLSGLVPATKGTLAAAGWVRRRDGRFAGSVTGSGGTLAAGNVRMQTIAFTAALGEGKPPALGIDAQAQGLAYKNVVADRARVSVKGSTEAHTITTEMSAGKASAYASLAGGLKEKEWRGTITQLNGRDAAGTWAMESPTTLAVSRQHIAFQAFRVRSTRGESFAASADVVLEPVQGYLDAAWASVDIARAQPFLARGTIRGTTTGQAKVRWPEKSQRRLDARTEFAAEFTDGALKVPVKGSAGALWDAGGLKAVWAADTGNGGKISGQLTAGGAPDLKLPDRGALTASWEGLRLDMLHAWLPSGTAVKGIVAGRLDGTLTSGGIVNVTGQTQVTQGTVAWQPGDGVVTTAIESASGRFTWRGRSLDGRLSVVLGAYGRVEGTFSLPLPARLPAAFMPDGPLSLTVKGEVHEQGMISALMPGTVQEAKGILSVDVATTGTWRQPGLAGTIILRDAGAYLPAAGIRLEKVRAEATLAGDTIHVRQARAESGGGWMEASGDIRVDGGRLLRYQGSARGEGFQVLNLPDIRAYASPAITIQGDPAIFSARGDITIPQMTIYGKMGEDVVRPSSDVVVVDAPAARKKKLPLGVDIRIRVILGEKVSIVASGIDARLAGALDVAVADIDEITARGRISIVEGSYKAYGVRLTITRGNITFVGPADRPILDILAVRKANDVTAGVEVTGSARSPVATLYSNPPMSDQDKLAYVVLGHRLTQGDSTQSSTFLSGAGVFDSGTPTMATETRRRLGLEAPGAQEEAARSALSIGRYLAPGFYVSIGRSLLTNQNVVALRYTLSKHWEVESRLGGVTGMDLFYRIEFE